METNSEAWIFEISVKTPAEKRDFEKMTEPVITESYLNECIETSRKLRKTKNA